MANINRSTFYEKYDDISALADAYAKACLMQILAEPWMAQSCLCLLHFNILKIVFENSTHNFYKQCDTNKEQNSYNSS